VPILEVEIVLRPRETLPADLAAQLADRAAAALGSQPGGTWVKLRTLAPEQYAEGGGGPPEGVFPVFVSVLKTDLPSPDQLAAEIANLTEAIARACGRRPENVHILYQPPARGRIAFGGRLLR
jgi:phenylpyruvate tautomerase PptA (4-oxalocrotonate tautomerase family)